jgi:hypothetical protein
MNERLILSKMYFDVADIYRISQVEDNDGLMKQNRQKIYEDIKCSLSKKTISSLNPDTNTNTLIMKHMLFVSDEIDIKPSDIVYVKNKNEYFKAGEGLIYPASHSEILLTQSEKVSI